MWHSSLEESALGVEMWFSWRLPLLTVTEDRDIGS